MRQLDALSRFASTRPMPALPAPEAPVLVAASGKGGTGTSLGAALLALALAEDGRRTQLVEAMPAFVAPVGHDGRRAHERRERLHQRVRGGERDGVARGDGEQAGDAGGARRAHHVRARSGVHHHHVELPVQRRRAPSSSECTP